MSLRSRGQVQKIRPHALVCPILGHTQPAALGARACRDRRRLAKRFWRGGAAQGRGPSKLGRRRRYARLVAEIVGSHRSLVYFRSFLVEMPGSAPTLIRENATLRTQEAGTRHGLGDTAVAGFSVLCRLRDRSYVVGSAQYAPATAVMRRVSRDVEAALSPDNTREIPRARPSLIFER